MGEMIQFDLGDLHIFSTGLVKPPTTIIRTETHEKSRFWPPKNWVIESFKPFVSTKNHLLMGGAEPHHTFPTNKFDRKAPEATFGLPPFGSQQSFGAGGER